MAEFKIRAFQPADVDAVTHLRKAALPSSQPWNVPRVVVQRKQLQADQLFLVRLLNETDEIQKCTASIPCPYTEDDAEQWLQKVYADSAELTGNCNWKIRHVSEGTVGCIGARAKATCGATSSLRWDPARCSCSACLRHDS